VCGALQTRRRHAVFDVCHPVRAELSGCALVTHAVDEVFKAGVAHTVLDGGRARVIQSSRVAGETYHLAQLERVHPEHGSAEVVAQPHSFKSSVVQRLIFYERVRARQVTCDIRPETVQIACLIVAERILLS